MARSIFNGTLRLDGVGVPVKLYAAVEPRPVSFRLLHEADRAPIRQRMVHPETGEEVAHEQVRKGLVLPGGMVVLREEELAELEPEASREIEILRFVAPARLNHQWYVRPYYLGPGGEPEDYFALARALAAEDKEGIVRWTMRKKVYRGALRARGDYLVLISLRSAAEIVAIEALPELPWPSPSKAELKMARQLLEMLEGELDWDQFHDRYAEQVVALAEAKAEGRVVKLPRVKPKPAQEGSLSDALAASLARLEERGVG
ncbi:MAG: Ku protein [Enhygromyxa sp.]